MFQIKTKVQQIFYYMHDVFHKRFTCEDKFAKDIKAVPNPPGNTLKRWDATKSQDCTRKTPEQNINTSYKSSACTSSYACTIKAYVLNGNFVGYTQCDLKSEQSTACSNSISKYIQSYGGGSEVKKDLENCDGKTIYLCNSMQYDDFDSYKACEIDQAITKCKLNLEKIRQERSGGPHTVQGDGLPPCGQEVWVCNNTISNKACS